MKRLVHIAVSLPLIFGAATAKSQNLAGDQAAAAFECAALAAHAADSSPIRKDAERLFAYGYEKAKNFFSDEKMRRGLEREIPWVHPANIDFWIGFSWATYMFEINKLIDNKASPGKAPYSVIKNRQRIEAEKEFSRRNCRLIGHQSYNSRRDQN
jgi:hypothetical protein